MKIRARVMPLLLATLAGACAASTEPGPPGSGACTGAGTSLLDGGGCLEFQDDGALEAFRPDIDREVRRTMAAARPLIPVDGVDVRILAGTATVIPEIGIGGRAFGGDVVQLAFDPESPALPASLQIELFPLFAHELHHIARQRTVGYGADLLGAMISEGLADHFSLEVAGGAPPPWSTALTESELAEWGAAAEEQWFDRGYDHDAWFFGTGPTVPRWAGYSIGFDMVGRYLAKDPDRRASALYDTPRQEFIPSD